VARCHISLSTERHTSSPSSTRPRGRCGPIRLGKRTVFARSLRIGSQWSRIRWIRSWNAYGPIMGESTSLMSSSNSAENVASEENLPLLTVRSKMELQNGWIEQSKNGLFLCCTILHLWMASGPGCYSRLCTLSTRRRVGFLDWFLYMAELAFKNSSHSSTGYIPFFANTRDHPRWIMLEHPHISNNPSVQDRLLQPDDI
jgi:hypothetical protein